MIAATRIAKPPFLHRWEISRIICVPSQRFTKLNPLLGKNDQDGRVNSGSLSGAGWQDIARAIRHGNRILVSGTTATHGSGEMICPGDPAGQAAYIDKIVTMSSLGGGLEDVVQTRVYLADADHWQAVSEVIRQLL